MIDQTFEHIKIDNSSVLRVRFGLVYPAGESPRNAAGMLRLNHSPGKRNPYDKLYIPAEGVDLLKMGHVIYEFPASVTDAPAPYGELLFNARDGWEILFGRQGEIKPFTFNEGQFYLPLRVYRDEEIGFNPVFVKVKRHSDNKIFYLVISMCWIDNVIALSVQILNESDEAIPEHLREAEL